MKRVVILAVFSVAVACVVAPVTGRADTDVYVGVNFSSTQEFYQPLQAHGTWIQTANYGQCWRPAYVENGWRPYTNGAWVWTDYGWYWTTSEPWGWATYHYGRWVLDGYYGWVWVPDVEWAPAWVAWREGGGYVGWAPMPPQCSWGNGGYFVYQEAWVSPSWFVFIGVGNFCRPITRHNCIVNQNYIRQTVNCTKIKQVNNIVINYGPSYESVRRGSADRVREVNLHRIAPGSTSVERRVPPAMQEWQQKQNRGQGYAGGYQRVGGSTPRVSKRDLPGGGGFTAPIKKQEIRTENVRPDRPIVIRPQPERVEERNLRPQAEYPVIPSHSRAQQKQERQNQQEQKRMGPPTKVSVPAVSQPSSDQQRNSDDRRSRRRDR